MFVLFACLWVFVWFCVCVFCCLSEDGPYSSPSLLQVMVVDGDSGLVTWSYSIPCHMKETPATSAATVEQKSVFLFWAEGPSAASPNPVSEPNVRWHLLLRLTGSGGLIRPAVFQAVLGRDSDLDGWETQKGRRVCVHKADLLHRAAETSQRWEESKLVFLVIKSSLSLCPSAEDEGSPGVSQERCSDMQKADLRTDFFLT